MPRYEMALIVKAMQRPETVATLKRTIETLMEKGAIVRNLENLGEKNLPYKISKHNQRHTRGGYFLVDFYSPPNVIPSVLDHLSRDIDVIRPNILLHDEEKPPERPCPGLLPPTNLESKFSRRKKK
ncbi:small ribosomal subunit protein bS6m [Leptodactylus fuscus]|uniref:small ribosomal subunit protein bS6m n=1 Tax=Leptodactylus fuscus TaxID=238119 RepID=UPI003F4F38EF